LIAKNNEDCRDCHHILATAAVNSFWTLVRKKDHETTDSDAVEQPARPENLASTQANGVNRAAGGEGDVRSGNWEPGVVGK
jgi:hypothetical protein